MKKIPYIEDFEQWKKEFHFFIPIKVRFSETDMYQHVNNVSAFIYFEEARIDYLQHIGFMEEMAIHEGAVIVADLQCDYHRQMFFNEKLKVFVKTNSVGRTSFDLHYMTTNEKEEITLTGRGRVVFIDALTGKPKPLTESMKEKLKEK